MNPVVATIFPFLVPSKITAEITTVFEKYNLTPKQRADLLHFYSSIPLEIKKQFISELNKYFPKNILLKVKNRIVGKIQHVFIDVPLAVEKILSPHHSKNIQKIRIAAFIHDVGRFRESHIGILDNSGFNHAQFASDWINELNSNYPATLVSDDLSELSESVRLHSQPTINQKASLTTRYLRDADKLAIARKIKEKTKQQTVFEYLPNQGISEDVLTSFLESKFVSRSSVKTQADKLLVYLSWVFDLNFPQTLKSFLEENIVDTFLQLLKEKEAKSEKIKAVINSLQEHYVNVLKADKSLS